jgi:hypothetical protein
MTPDTLQALPDTVHVLTLAAQHSHHIHWASNVGRVLGLAFFAGYVTWSTRQ